MEETTPDTANAATETVELEANDTVLLGLMAGPEGNRAMLRYRDGEIGTVFPGDETPDGQVVAIDEQQVVLARMIGHVVLTMPTG